MGYRPGRPTKSDKPSGRKAEKQSLHPYLSFLPPAYPGLPGPSPPTRATGLPRSCTLGNTPTVFCPCTPTRFSPKGRGSGLLLSRLADGLKLQHNDKGSGTNLPVGKPVLNWEGRGPRKVCVCVCVSHCVYICHCVKYVTVSVYVSLFVTAITRQEFIYSTSQKLNQCHGWFSPPLKAGRLPRFSHSS